MGLVALEQVGRAAQGVDHAGEALGGGAGGKGASSELLGPAAASAARPARASASPHRASITSASCGSAGSPLSMAMASRTSTALPAAVAEALAHFGEQGHGRQARAVGDADDAAGQGLGRARASA